MVVSNRRTFNKLALSTMLISVFSSVYLFTQSAQALRGAKIQGSYDLFGRSGDDDFDRALIAELKKIIHVLGINPGFKYTNSMDAYALMETLVPGTNGTVILGLPLMKALMQEADGGAGVAGMCAHECGHIYQFQNGFSDRILQQATGRTVSERHADFIAGYYMGRRKTFAADQIRKVSRVLYTFGDYYFESPYAHGTPGQRTAALEKGYRVALDGNTMAMAAEIGLSYVMNL